MLLQHCTGPVLQLPVPVWSAAAKTAKERMEVGYVAVFDSRHNVQSRDRHNDIRLLRGDTARVERRMRPG